MNRITHFEIQVGDIERATKFYQAVFGWEIRRWEGPMEYVMVMTGTGGSEMAGREGQGIDGGMVLRQGEVPADGAPINAFVCTAEVENINDILVKVSANGGDIVVKQDTIPGVGTLAYCKDTEGNTFGVIQNEAK